MFSICTGRYKYFSLYLGQNAVICKINYATILKMTCEMYFHKQQKYLNFYWNSPKRIQTKILGLWDAITPNLRTPWKACNFKIELNEQKLLCGR